MYQRFTYLPIINPSPPRGPQVHLKVVGVLATLRGHWTKNCYRLLENGDFNHDSSSRYTARMCQEIAMDRSKDSTSQV